MEIEILCWKKKKKSTSNRRITQAFDGDGVVFLFSKDKNGHQIPRPNTHICIDTYHCRYNVETRETSKFGTSNLEVSSLNFTSIQI